MSFRAAFLAASSPLPLRRQSALFSCSQHPQYRARKLTTTAVQGIDYYAQEGIGDLESSLPDSVIYASLRRKAEAMCVDAAIAVCMELAGAGPSLSSPSSLTPVPNLSPRDVVEVVLTAMRDDPLAGGRVVIQFASEANRFSRCTPETFFHWLSTSEFKYMLEVSSFYVAPVPIFGTDFRRCVVSCVVNTTASGRRAISFNMVRVSSANDAWMIDSVFNG